MIEHPGGHYVETNALLALMEDDPAECERLLLGMYPKELEGLIEVASELVQMMAKAARVIVEREGGPRNG